MLISFKKYLKTLRLGLGTSRLYLHWIRRLLAATGDQIPTATLVLVFDAEIDRPQRCVFRSAWRHYAKHLQAEGKEPPTVTFPRRKFEVDPRIADVHPIQATLAELLEYLKPTVLARMTWGSLTRVGKDTVYLTDPMRAYQSFEVPLKPMKALRAWAPPKDTTSPLVPEEPGSMTPMNTRRLARAARAMDLQDLGPD